MASDDTVFTQIVRSPFPYGPIIGAAFSSIDPLYGFSPISAIFNMAGLELNVATKRVGMADVISLDDERALYEINPQILFADELASRLVIARRRGSSGDISVIELQKAFAFLKIKENELLSGRARLSDFPNCRKTIMSGAEISGSRTIEDGALFRIMFSNTERAEHILESVQHRFAPRMPRP